MQMENNSIFTFHPQLKKKKSGRLSANWTNPEPEMKYPEFLAKGHLEDVNQIHLAVEVIRRSATSL